MSVFLAFLAINSAVKSDALSLWRSAPEFWIYPLQTFVCAGLLLYFWRRYSIRRPRLVGLTLAVAVLVFALWISPQQWFHLTPRTMGFNPDVFATRPSLYWPTVAMRFLRLVVVVPFVEEIFWRGFLLRYVVNERFEDVEIGTFSWPSFAVVTVAFALAHSMADWPAALITSALYNFVAYRSRSLGSCILAHAVTNLLLGLWIMATRQWGFW